MYTLHEKFELGINLLLVVLLFFDICFTMYRSGKRRGESTVPSIEVYVVPREKTEFQDIKAAATSSDVVRELTSALETITLDKNKSALLEVSNGASGGFIVRKKFGSS